MPDLFGPALLPGLRFAREIVDMAEEQALVAALTPLSLQPFEFQGWLGKRQVTSFGWRYDFTEARFARAPDLPDFLVPLRDRAAALAGLQGGDLVQTLITRYDPGAGIGWHRDRPVFDTVIGISLLSDATLRFRRRTPQGFDRFALPMPARSAYTLSGEARHDWEHGITPLDETRWSITFRSLSERGRAIRTNVPD